METDLNNPYSYNTWLAYNESIIPENSQSEYLKYIKDWYFHKSTLKDKTKRTIKEDYIQLLKDIKFLFGDSEFDNFISDINYNNDEELIYTIPFFAKKLKQIALILCRKRESVKQAKLKYNLVGSNAGLEKLLYEYILKGFSKSNSNVIQIPTNKLSKYFPDLLDIKNDFLIEVEELHDKNVYLGSDSSVKIENYIDVEKLSNNTISTYFKDLSDTDVLKLISTKFLTKISNSYLSNAFVEFLTSDVPTLTTETLFNNKILNVYNQIEASKKYLSEPMYGLTAVKLKDINQYDNFLTLNFNYGNNWFYWPSGIRNLDESSSTNIFEEIHINNSSFFNSSATAGDDYTNSDLIFTDKNGIVEGAWLQGTYKTNPIKENMRVTINAGSPKEFIFPFVGVDFSTKTSAFLGYKITDDDNVYLDALNPKTKQQILTKYFSSTLPLSTCQPLYINNTTLIKSGAHADIFSNTADIIIKKNKEVSSDVYRERLNGKTEQAYLYKFNRTDLPISPGLNNIYWPLQKYTEDGAVPLTLDRETCIPVKLKDLNVKENMIGCCAGLKFSSSDVIYKMNDRAATDPAEAAWLGAPSISRLDILKNSIPVYDTPPVKCAQFVDGPIQSSLSLYVESGRKQSFIWMGEDTPADEVFKYVDHSPSCPYLKDTPHDYYEDQDYQNKSPINDKKHWKKCNCKSVNYSPIGHSGDIVFDFNGMADYLFADPDGVGEDFAINSWSDTRGFIANNSPQFSFFKLTRESSTFDTSVGWGVGEWKTGNGKQMILKTGRRYTYYRTSMRTSYGQIPYFVNKYSYKKINGLLGDTSGFDLVIIIDNSKSQSLNLEISKKAAYKIIDTILTNNKNNTQIGLIEFNSISNKLSYLSKQKEKLKLFVSQIQTPTNDDFYNTNIIQSILVANQLLTETIASDEYESSFSAMCSNLNYLITDLAAGNVYTNKPQSGKPKKILIFSDGDDNVNLDIDGAIENEIKTLTNNNNIEVYSIKIGNKSNKSNLLSNIASSPATFFDLESFLNIGDGDVETFISYIIMRIYGSMPINTLWYKAVRDNFGNWVEKYDDLGNLEISDMELHAGDYIAYIHRSYLNYINEDIFSVSFNMKSLSFTMNVKLNGWDYNLQKFSKLHIGSQYGAKPFWAVVETDENETNNFRKDTLRFGGKIKFVDDYLPVQQPDVSTIVFNNGDFVEYHRNYTESFIWNQPILLSNSITSNQWMKLLFKIDFSNLKDFLYKQKLDGVLYATKEPSDLVLESYSAFKPALFNYYARNPFTYNQGLYNKNRCLESFVVYNTGVLISPSNAFENMVNNMQPSVASVSLPYNVISERECGFYLLPENLGASFYRGRGYEISIDNNKLTTFKMNSSEPVYFDLGKYGSRTRGLTKKDQLTISKIDNIDNTWIYEPYSNAERSGVIVNTLENQKLTPYQSTYEIIGKNNHGIARQSDIISFWDPPVPPTWSDPEKYPLTFRKEVTLDSYNKKKEMMLVDKGILQTWKTDIFSINYGLYKQLNPNDFDGLLFWHYSNNDVISKNAASIYDYDTKTQDNDFVVRWGDAAKRKRDFAQYYGRPKYNTLTTNKIPTITFDGEEGLDTLLLKYDIDVDELSFFIVARYTDTIHNKPNVLFGLGDAVSAGNVFDFTYPALAISNIEDKIRFSYGNTATEERVDLTNNDFDIDLNQFHIYEMHYNKPECYAYIDGSLFGTTEGTPNFVLNGIYSTTGLWLGAYTGGAFSSRCEISEVIMFNRKLTNLETSKVRGYLNKKYSIY